MPVADSAGWVWPLPVGGWLFNLADRQTAMIMPGEREPDYVGALLEIE